MNRMSRIVLSATLAFGVSAAAPASTDAAVKSFKNCTELNKSYKGGVAKDSKVKNKGGKTK